MRNRSSSLDRHNLNARQFQPPDYSTSIKFQQENSQNGNFLRPDSQNSSNSGYMPPPKSFVPNSMYRQSRNNSRSQNHANFRSMSKDSSSSDRTSRSILCSRLTSSVPCSPDRRGTNHEERNTASCEQLSVNVTNSQIAKHVSSSSLTVLTPEECKKRAQDILSQPPVINNNERSAYGVRNSTRSRSSTRSPSKNINQRPLHIENSNRNSQDHSLQKSQYVFDKLTQSIANHNDLESQASDNVVPVQNAYESVNHAPNNAYNISSSEAASTDQVQLDEMGAVLQEKVFSFTKF